MELNQNSNSGLNSFTEIISEILKLYDKIPSESQSSQMIDSFLDHYKVTDENKIFIKENLAKYKISNFNQEGIINLIQEKIQRQFDIDDNNANKIVYHGLDYIRNYIIVKQNNHRTDLLKSENNKNEQEFSEYISELNLTINSKIEILKNRITGFKNLDKNLKFESFITGTYALLDKTEDQSLLNKKYNQIDNLLNNNTDEVLEL